jgi:hypothetical protein
MILIVRRVIWGTQLNTIVSIAKRMSLSYCKAIECKNVEFAPVYQPDQDADEGIANNRRN